MNGALLHNRRARRGTTRSSEAEDQILRERVVEVASTLADRDECLA